MADAPSWKPQQIGSGPTYNVMTDADFLDEAFNESFSQLRTTGMVGAEAFRKLPGIGTAYRMATAPADGPTDPGYVVDKPDGTKRTIPFVLPTVAPAYSGMTDIGARPETQAEFQQRRVEAGAMEQEAWANSRYFRPGLAWDKGVTEERAAAMAENYDRTKLIDFYAAKRPVTAFVAGLLPGFVDPINYIPIFGWGTRGVGLARTVGMSAADAMANTALFGTLTMNERRKLGDDVSFGSLAQDVAMAGLAGAGIGSVVHGISAAARGVKGRIDAPTQAAVKESIGTLEAQQQARIPLSEAVIQMAGGQPVRLGENSQAIVGDMAAEVSGIVQERQRYAVTPTGMRIEVRPEVIDASQLLAASGDLQPRDRTRAASDAQIADMAANLDPDRLLPTPEADRGAPIIGPDNIVESGNGRVAAIRRAAEQHSERFEAYRKALRDAGYDVPEGGVPVLVSRRVSDLSPDQRVGFVQDANTSAIARMSATEQALADTRAMTDSVVDLHAGGEIGAAGNRPFVAAFLRGLPENERAALADKGGALNADGVRRVERTLVAAAYGDADLVARMAESLDDNAKSITGAMVDSAGRWAQLRRQFTNREYDADLDVTSNILEALRTVSKAREDAGAQGRPVHTVLGEALRQSDMFSGRFDPRTESLIRGMFQGPDLKRVRSREAIGAYLDALAEEIDAAGKPQLFGDKVAAADIIEGARRRVAGEGLFDEPAARRRPDDGDPAQGRVEGGRADRGRDVPARGAEDRGSAGRRPGDQQGAGSGEGRAEGVSAGRWNQPSLQQPTPASDLAAAHAAVGKADTFKAIAEQYKVDPATGGFAEEADLAQVLAEGRLSSDDMATLQEARDTFDNADAFDQALQAAARCVI